jgi:hypothetical protein
MTPEATAFANALLDRHQHVCLNSSKRDDCVISYKELSERAKLPFLTRSAGPFLAEIADWCRLKGWPPINALAVRQDFKIPGDGYDGAGGFLLKDWEDDVQACIDFRGYPKEI